MATASKVSISTSHIPQYHTTDWSEATGVKTSEVLQENHEQHHIYFNPAGFHNHIVHHILSLYAVGAQPDDIVRQYNFNKSYQRSVQKPDEKVVQDFEDEQKFKAELGNEKSYADFLAFFQRQIELTGWKDVVNKFLFAGDETADDLLVRTFAGMSSVLFKRFRFF
jgi:hypothetical protein